MSAAINEISKFIPFIYLTWALASDYFKLLVLWEGNKIQRNLPFSFDVAYLLATKFCCLLRKPQLWVLMYCVLTRQFFTDVNLGRLYIGQVNVIGMYWSLTVWTLGIADLGMQTGNCKYKRRPQHSDWGHF